MFYHKKTFHQKCKCLLVVAVVLILCCAQNVWERQMAVTLCAGSLVFVILIVTTVTNFSDHKHNSGIDDHMRDLFKGPAF